MKQFAIILLLACSSAARSAPENTGAANAASIEGAAPVQSTPVPETTVAAVLSFAGFILMFRRRRARSR